MIKDLFKKIYTDTINPSGKEDISHYIALTCLYKQGLLDDKTISVKEWNKMKKIMSIAEGIYELNQNTKFTTYPEDIRLFKIKDIPEVYLFEKAIVIAGAQEYLYAKEYRTLYSLEYNQLSKEELVSMIEDLGSIVYLYVEEKLIKVLHTAGYLPPSFIQGIREHIERTLNRFFERKMINI